MARRVQALLTAGATPSFAASADGLLLRAGRRYTRLTDDGGALTDAGVASKRLLSAPSQQFRA